MLSAPWIETRARLTPDRVALECDGQALSYAELHERARALAAGLRTRGLQPGDVCAGLLANGLDFALLLHAADLLGLSFLPLNVRLTPRELTFPLGDSAARLLIHAGDELAARAERTARSAPGVDTLAVSQLVGDPGRSLPAPSADPDAVLAILYTSGTTGRPKGARLSRRNFAASALASALHSGVLPQDRWLACMPLFHVGGLSILVRSVLYGTTALVHERFDPQAVDRALDEDRVTSLSLTPTMLQRLLEVRGGRPAPQSLRSLLLGGGPCPPALLERAEKQGFPVAPTYGLTEACSQVATRLPEDPDRGALTPLPGVEVRIAGDDGEALPVSRPGEIWVRGDSVMRSYLTPSVARGGDANPRPDGWLRTGDIGSLDPRGRLHVHDRRSDLIISGGENVYPAEVEAVLLTHPAIEEAAVASVPDADYGQRPAAWIVPARGATLPEPATLVAWCRQRLAGFKVPVAFYPSRELPRTSAGKLRRHALAPPTPAGEA